MDPELTSMATSNTHIHTQKESWRSRHLKGWRFGTMNGALLALIVFLLNFVITLFTTVSERGATNAQNTLFSGNCSQARQLNTWIHLLINALSTILLGASNYCMQCLSAPTRTEVDRAHASGRWLDIGVLSIRNIRSISGTRAIVWALLGATSFPLHLL
jgi:hypothetical protein